MKKSTKRPVKRARATATDPSHELPEDNYPWWITTNLWKDTVDGLDARAERAWMDCDDGMLMLTWLRERRAPADKLRPWVAECALMRARQQEWVSDPMKHLRALASGDTTALESIRAFVAAADKKVKAWEDETKNQPMPSGIRGSQTASVMLGYLLAALAPDATYDQVSTNLNMLMSIGFSKGDKRHLSNRMRDVLPWSEVCASVKDGVAALRAFVHDAPATRHEAKWNGTLRGTNVLHGAGKVGAYFWYAQLNGDAPCYDSVVIAKDRDGLVNPFSILNDYESHDEFEGLHDVWQDYDSFRKSYRERWSYAFAWERLTVAFDRYARRAPGQHEPDDELFSDHSTRAKP